MRERFGLLSFIIHPDYTTSVKATKLFESLLGWLADRRDNDDLWLPLPREINSWWRRRNAMIIEDRGGRWAINGPDTDDAVLAFASLRDGKLTFQLETGEHFED